MDGKGKQGTTDLWPNVVKEAPIPREPELRAAAVKSHDKVFLEGPSGKVSLLSNFVASLEALKHPQLSMVVPQA